MSGDSKGNNKKRTTKSRIKKKQAKRKAKRKENTPTQVSTSIMSPSELQRYTRENSFILNPMLANAWFQKDLEFAVKRSNSAETLHDYLFDPLRLSQFEDKDLISLYGIAINDVNKRTQINLKLAETSEKHRLVRENMKIYLEMEKQRNLETPDNPHTSEILEALINESLRKSLDDEIRKKWGDNNSYRPPENEDYKIIAIDPDAD